MAYRFEPAVESMPRGKLAALQLKRLRQTVKNAYENVPLHRKRMRKIGIEPGAIPRSQGKAVRVRDLRPNSCSRLTTPWS